MPKSYHEVAAEIGVLISEKQKAYGNSFGRSGDIIRILYPRGIDPDQFDHALTIIRVIDKLFRIATQREAFGEDPWRDIAGYAILSVTKMEDAGEGRK